MAAARPSVIELIAAGHSSVKMPEDDSHSDSFAPEQFGFLKSDNGRADSADRAFNFEFCDSHLELPLLGIHTQAEPGLILFGPMYCSYCCVGYVVKGLLLLSGAFGRRVNGQPLHKRAESITSGFDLDTLDN